jgi:hypothetical protein
MSKGKGFIGCTRCYKKKVDCKCIIPDFHIIQPRAFYYNKFVNNYPELLSKIGDNSEVEK